jgi:hypothetical protein
MEWVALIMTVVSFLATVFLTPKPKLENARPSNLSDVRFPRSDEGSPVPLVFGTVRLRGPNTIWMGDFQTIAITQKVKTGLFSSKRQTIGYKYYVGLDLALCLGPGVVLKRIWAGKHTVWSGTVSTEDVVSIDEPELFGGEKQRGGLQGDVAFYPGDFSATQDAYVAGFVGSDLPRYGGICHAVFRSFYVGTSPQLEPFSFELQRLTDGLGLGAKAIVNGVDMNPMELLYDAVAQRWGRLGIDVADLDVASWTACGNTLYDEGNGMSLMVDRANTGKDIVEEVLRQIDGVLYQDPETGKIVAKLIRADYTLGSLASFDPSNVAEMSEFTAQTWAETYNQCRVVFTNRAKDYVDGTSMEQNLAGIGFQGRVRSLTKNFPAVNTAEQAAYLAARSLSYVCVPLAKCRLVMNREALALRPGTPFKLTWPEYGLTDAVFRAQRFDLGEVDNGRVIVEAAQDRFADPTPINAAPEESQWVEPDRSAQALLSLAVNEMPYFLAAQFLGVTPADAEGRVMAFARKSSSYAITMEAWQDTASGFTDPSLALEPVPFPASGLVAVAYSETEGSTTGLDSALGLVIGSLSSGFVPTTTDAAGVRSGTNLAIVGGELIAFTGVTDLGGGQYRLTNVYRGLLDTLPATHAVGVPVFFITDADCLPDTPFGATSTVYTRLLETTSLGTFPLASAANNAVTLNQRTARPLPPANTQVGGSRTPPSTTLNSAALTWVERNRTSGSIALQTDGTVAAEAGTSYIVRISTDGGAATEVSVGAVTSYALDITGRVGTNKIDVFAERGGLRSRVASLPVYLVKTS